LIRIIPSLLLKNRKLVKGVKFKEHKNAGNPKTTILSLESQKADEILLIDLDAYEYSKSNDLETLKEISEISSTPLTFGGGINSFEKAKKILTSGADKIYINSSLIKDKNLIDQIAYTFGSQSIVGGIDIIKKKNNFFIASDKTYKIDPINYAKELQERGIGEIKITYKDLEGSRQGMEIDYSKKLKKAVNVPIIFEGGNGSLEDILNCCNQKIFSIALGTMIVFSDNNIIKIKSFLRNFGHNVRL